MGSRTGVRIRSRDPCLFFSVSHLIGGGPVPSRRFFLACVFTRRARVWSATKQWLRHTLLEGRRCLSELAGQLFRCVIVRIELTLWKGTRRGLRTPTPGCLARAAWHACIPVGKDHHARATRSFVSAGSHLCVCFALIANCPLAPFRVLRCMHARMRIRHNV